MWNLALQKIKEDRERMHQELKVEKRTSLEVELLEIIETYRKSGYPDKYILGQFEKVLNIVKDPEPEIKGEWDT